MKRSLLLSLSFILLPLLPAFAQDQSAPAGQTKLVATGEKPEGTVSEEAQAEALQKATQNPVANLISVPLQNNTNFNYGPYNRDQDVLNIQPVIPAHISKTGCSSPASSSRSYGSRIRTRIPAGNTAWAT